MGQDFSYSQGSSGFLSAGPGPGPFPGSEEESCREREDVVLRLRFSESAYSRWDVLGIMVLLSFFPAAWLWADNGTLPSMPDRGLAVGVVLGLGAFILLLLLRLYHLHQLMARQALVLARNRAAQERQDAFQNTKNEVLNLLIQHRPLPDVLKSLVLSVEHSNPGMLCSVLLLDEEGKRLLTGAAPSLPEFYNRAIHGTEIGLGVGSCGTAAYIGERVIVSDIQTHPYWEKFKGTAAEAGLAACWSEPIRGSSGKILGTFAIYHRTPHAPSADDMELIAYLAQLASLAIERARMQQALEESEERWKFALEGAGDGVWDWKVKTGEVIYSPRYREMLGYGVDDPYPNRIDSWLSRIHPDDVARVQTTVQGVLEGQIPSLSLEFRMRCKDGRWKWMLSRGMVVGRDGEGHPLRLIGTHADVSDRKAVEEQMRLLAQYDPLTGLPNRALLADRLQMALVQAKRDGDMVALLYLDLDNFKPVNDRFGHAAGDHLLREVAARLRDTVRDSDTVARIGGDEFILLLPAVKSQDDVLAVGGKILQVLAEPFSLPGGTASVTASIGAAIYPLHGADGKELTRRADAAMYRAKELGRNNIQLSESAAVLDNPA